MNLPEHLVRLGLTALPEPTAGAGITVAVLDGGVAPVDALAGRLERIDHTGAPDTAEPTEHATRCASLIAARHPDTCGVAPGARILSLNVSRDDDADPARVAAALDLLIERGVPVASCSFVLEHLQGPLARAAFAYVRRGFLLVGASGNARYRRQYEFVRSIPGALRVFANRVDSASDSLADEISAPGRRLSVVGVDGQLDPAWPGQSSGATALVAGLAARWLAEGLSTTEVRSSLRTLLAL